MTTIAEMQNTLARLFPVEQCTGTVRIPLAEFGKSLDDADLDEWFEAFAERNSDEGQYEISNKGYLVVMTAPGMPVCLYELQLAAQLLLWTRKNDGIALGSTGCYVLPDNSYLSPDASWMPQQRWRELMLPENRPFPRTVPDFVAEIKSPANTRAELIDKILLFLEHGSRLAWFIDAETRTVIKFRPGQEPETLHDPEYIDGDDDVLPGFRFAVRERIFDLFADTEQQEAENAAGEQGSPD